MNFLSVCGRSELHGSVNISGAKNSVLPILAATLLCGGSCVLHNCPKIDDVENTLSILCDLGAKIKRSGHTLTVDTTDADGYTVSPEAAAKMRSSVIFLGALLGRFRMAKLAMPGGCPLGKRPIDMHLAALASLGAQFLICKQRLFARCVCPCAKAVHLPFASVGATENVILFAVTLPGTTVLSNAAKEPEIVDLVRFLQKAGADITGEGTSEITIHGGKTLHAVTHTIMPDRIEAATFLCACAGCGGAVTLNGANAADIEPIISVLQSAGCDFSFSENQIAIRAGEKLKMPKRIVTAPYPAFPTDAQAVMMAALLRAEGRCEFCETVFENRLCHAEEFCRMGADIAVFENRAVLLGTKRLCGAILNATDLRAAAALVIAAMQAEGESRIFGVHHIRRGYERPEEKLKNLGADIKNVEIPIEIVYNMNG